MYLLRFNEFTSEGIKWILRWKSPYKGTKDSKKLMLERISCLTQYTLNQL